MQWSPDTRVKYEHVSWIRQPTARPLVYVTCNPSGYHTASTGECNRIYTLTCWHVCIKKSIYFLSGIFSSIIHLLKLICDATGHNFVNYFAETGISPRLTTLIKTLNPCIARTSAVMILRMSEIRVIVFQAKGLQIPARCYFWKKLNMQKMHLSIHIFAQKYSSLCLDNQNL